MLLRSGEAVRPLRPRFFQSLLQCKRNLSQQLATCQYTLDVKPPSKAQTQAFLRSTKAQPAKYDKFIDVNSLRRTLDAHREANRASLIRKYDQAGTVTSLSIPSPLEDEEEEAIPVSSTERDKAEVNSPAVYRPLGAPKLHLLPLNQSNNPQNLNARHHEMAPAWRFQPKLPGHMRYPWLRHITSGEQGYEIPAMRRLEAEIRAFDVYMTPTAEEQEAYNLALADIEKQLEETGLGTQFEVIGSRATGLAMPLSDIDLNLVSGEGVRSDDVTQRKEVLAFLKTIYKTLQKQSSTRSATSTRLRLVAPIFRARIPLIVGVHIETGLQFQIQQTISAYNTMEYAKVFLREFPTLRQLFTVVKQMLRIRGLSDGYNGGVGSYPLLNMIVASLKASQGTISNDDVAGQLLFFLDMFSELDTHTTGISVQPFGFIRMESKHQTRFSTSDAKFEGSRNSNDRHTVTAPEYEVIERLEEDSSLLYLRDPADPSHDLGRTARKILQIQGVFIAARYSIYHSIEKWQSTTSRSPGPGVNTLLTHLRGDYSIYEYEREALCDFARSRRNS